MAMMIPKLVYISQGNVPSKWAHSMQAMKMAEALAPCAHEFAFLTQAHWSAMFRPRFDYEGWYGISRRFRIKRLYTRTAPFDHMFEGVRYPAFDERAARYAARVGAAVYTRSPYAGRRASELGTPTIIETHMETDHVEFAHVFSAMEQDAFLGLVTITPEKAARYVAAGVPEDRLMIWPDAVSLRRFHEVRERKGLRRSLGLPDDRRVAVFCGNLYGDRGIEDILSSARVITDTLFVIVGGWEKDVAQCRAKAESLENVRFTGFVKNAQVPGYLCAADVLLMPNSKRLKTAEWMSPMKMFEYMAAGRPIVASDHAVLRAVLKDGENSVLIPPDDPEAMTDALLRIEKDTEFAESLGKNALRDVEPYSWENRARDIVHRFFAETTSSLPGAP